MKEASRLLVTLLLAATSSCITVAQDRHGAEALEPGVGVAVQLKRSELEGALEGPGGQQQQQERDGAVATGYSLVEDTPRCYYGLGPKYCPAPGSGQGFVDVYMSSLQRTSQVLTNMARVDPKKFKTLYMGATNYACATSTKSPFRYSANLQQAAVQEAVMLANTSVCTFQHDTCSSYCSLYGGSCLWYQRIMKYQPQWNMLGENIARTYSSAAYNPAAALLMWLASSGHCTNIFSTNSHMGTGSVGAFWVQDFARYSDPTPNPLIDGSHYLDATATGGKLRFLVNYYTTTMGAATSLYVMVDGSRTLPLSLHLGNASMGTYSADLPDLPTGGCLTYYFAVTTMTGAAYTLPETGAFRTYGVAGCTANWATSRQPSPTTPSPTPAPVTKPPTKAPSPSPPTKTPTRSPTSPTRGPTSRPTKTPTKAPTAPTRTPSSSPTKPPTSRPTLAPSRAPTKPPTLLPTPSPSSSPTRAPTKLPTKAPTRPTTAPSLRPSRSPTVKPTVAPTRPTRSPTLRPTHAPTKVPSSAPSPSPTTSPTTAPTAPCFWPFCRKDTKTSG